MWESVLSHFSFIQPANLFQSLKQLLLTSSAGYLAIGVLHINCNMEKTAIENHKISLNNATVKAQPFCGRRKVQPKISERFAPSRPNPENSSQPGALALPIVDLAIELLHSLPGWQKNYSSLQRFGFAGKIVPAQ